tara:strand:+ start:105 stop:245 length:141 start_codon:yes stop_codon:yes gene_type:complete
MGKKQIITFRGDKILWDKWVLYLRKNKINIWDKIGSFIKEDINNEK